MMGSETKNVIEKLRESLLQRYPERLEELMRRRGFVCDSVDLLYYNLYRAIKLTCKR